jgi:hypothetical protein
MPVPSTVPNTTAASKPRSKFRTALYVIVSVAVSFALIVLVLGCLLLSKRTAYPLPQLGTDILTVNMGVLHRVLPEISRQDLRQSATLILTAKEVNQLLATLRIAHAGMESQVNAPPASSYDFRFQDGVLFVNHSLPRDGLTLHIYAEVVPGFRDGRIEADVKVCRVGRLPLPDWLIAERIRWANMLLKNVPEYQMLQEMLISLKVLPDGKVEVVYNPSRIVNELSGQIPLIGSSRSRKK